MRIIRLKVPEKTTARGTSLVQDLATTDLCLGIDGSPTFFRPPAARSPIDLTFYSPYTLITWEVAPDPQGSDYFLIPICVADRRFAPKHGYTVVPWDYYRTIFQKDTKPIEQSIAVNLHAATIHISLPVDSPPPDRYLYDNPFCCSTFCSMTLSTFSKKKGPSFVQSLKFSHSPPY